MLGYQTFGEGMTMMTSLIGGEGMKNSNSLKHQKNHI